MPGESLHKDLGELLEYWGEPERLHLPARDLARYLVASLAMLSEVLRALPTKEEEKHEENVTRVDSPRLFEGTGSTASENRR